MALKLVFAERGRGVTEKVSGPVPPLAVAVKLRVLPTLTVLLPMGSSPGPEETVNDQLAKAELAARSEMETETV